MFLLFVHRICFILSRAVAIVGIPFAILLVGGRATEDGITVFWLLEFSCSLFLAIIPIIFFKYVWRITCPSCGAKLDREIVGAGNYDCEECDASYS